MRSDAVSMLEFLMEHQDLNPTHLEFALGSKQIVAEILAGDRELAINV